MEIGRDPLRRALLHERPHALAGFVRVLERPEHRLVVDEPVALVQHALHVHAGVRRGPQHLAGGLERRVTQLVVGHDTTDDAESLGFHRIEGPAGEEEVTGDGDSDVGRQHRRVRRVREPRSSSGTRNVALSLATAMSASIAMSSPPAWQMPFTAAITGAWLSRTARNGSMSYPTASRHLLAFLGASAEVAARREDVAGADDDQRGQIRIGVDEPHRLLDAVVHRRRQGVAGRRAVDRAPGDRALPLEAQRRGAEVIEWSRAHA